MSLKCYFLIPAAGSGTRMGAGQPKLMRTVEGRPVILRTLDAIAEICNTRTESVSHGLNMINDAEDDDLVLVHDGARCLVTSEEIKACIDGLKDHSVCASAVPVKNTLKEVDKLSSGEIKVTSTPDRSRFYEILTPQGFKFKDIETCYIKAIDQGITATDDTALAEMCGIDVYLTKGLYSNLKITTPEDIAFASEIIRNRGDSEPFHD